MGCRYSSSKLPETKHKLTSEETSYLINTWNILKIHGIRRFADDVLIRSIRQNSSLRHFWISKMVIDSNNFDFSQGESCVRNELSWHIGLHEHSNQFIFTFENLLSSINDENLFLNKISTLHLLQSLSTLEHNSLMILQNCIIDSIREHFYALEYNFPDGYERAWNKFLTFINQFVLENDGKRSETKKDLISPVICTQQS